MNIRIALTVLQVVGTLSFLPYPFVLLANVMSIAATGQTRLGAAPFVLLSFYPLVWVALYVFSWRALARGAGGLALGLSSIPIFACLCVAGLWTYGSASAASAAQHAVEANRAEVQRINPLLWTIWSTAGYLRLPLIPSVPVQQALKEIDANPTLVNISVRGYGTPLKVAVMNLAINFDGSPILIHWPGNLPSQEDLFSVVRSLVAHGARFDRGETADLQLQWRLRRAMHEGPITTAAENPLVWRILTRKRGDGKLLSLQQDEIPLLNKPTGLHGTPLYAALLEDAPDLYLDLVNAGARLSKDEEQDPAASRALHQAFERNPDLQTAYERAPRRER